MINKRVIAGALVFALITGITGYKLFKPEAQGITATGTIEVTKADITPKVGGYLSGWKSVQGDRVERAQTLAKVARTDLDAQVLRDEAGLRKAKVQLHDLEIGARAQEMSDLEAAVQSAQSVYDKANLDYARYIRLFQEGAVAAQQLDAARSSRDVARNSLESARQRLSLLAEGNRADVLDAQRLEVERSEAILAASRTQAADTIISAPLSGVILTKNYEDNEYVNPGSPIATVGDLNDCWVKVYVASTQIGQIRLGQEAIVKIDSYPDREFAGTIKEIGQTAEFTPRQSITQRERATQVFAVKVKIDNAEGILKPGMPADVVIQ